MSTKSRLLFIFVLLPVLIVNCAKEPQWHEYISKDGRFSMMVPGRVKTAESLIERGEGKTYEMHFFWSKERLRYGTHSFNIFYVDMKPDDDSTFLQWFRQLNYNTIHEGAFGEISEEKDISICGYSGKEVVYKGSKASYTERFFLAHGRVYALVAGMSFGSRYQDHVFRFFDSFRLIE